MINIGGKNSPADAMLLVVGALLQQRAVIPWKTTSADLFAITCTRSSFVFPLCPSMMTKRTSSKASEALREGTTAAITVMEDGPAALLSWSSLACSLRGWLPSDATLNTQSAKSLLR